MPSKSDDPLASALSDATEQIVSAVRACDRANPVVLIDGRSGACKTTLAQRAAEAWPLEHGVQIISLDWLYPGWRGLQRGADRALEGILEPHSAGRAGRWRRWDWEQETPGPLGQLDPTRGVILEGCGALRHDTAALAQVRIWVESPASSRKERALDRDGDTFRPWWDMWAAQEQEHIDQEKPQTLASIQVELP